MSLDLLTALCATSLAAWLYLVFAHGRFWMGDQRLGPDAPDPERWPAVTAVVPARDEADVVGEAVAALLAQDYSGPFRVILVDDESEDGTGDAARAAAQASSHGERLEVLRAKPRPEGWVGKMWALHTGISHAPEPSEYLWLSDADVAPGPRSLRRLVARAERDGLTLASLMVRLHCARGWERLLVPAFVYFFQKLYPFPRVNDPASRTAGAAGGCVLVRAEALARAGGIEAIRGEIIDDCALARRVKQVGRIWLGLGEEERGLRPYPKLRDVWDMVARSAYTQLRYSPLVLAGTLVGLALLYALPVAALLTWPLHGNTAAALLGAAAWITLSISFLPTLALYERSFLLAPALPLAGILYAAMTFDSAWQHHRGSGASWKGRVGAGAASGEPGPADPPGPPGPD